MSVSVPRHCPECGSDTWLAQNFPKYRDKVTALEKELRRVAAAHAVEKAEWRLSEIDRNNESAFLARKAHKQRLVINRLEKRLRELGHAPHDEPQEPDPEAAA